MRRWQYVLILGTLLALLVPGLEGFAQDASPQRVPVVVFVEDAQLGTSSVMDPGPDGITRLEEIFKGLGAETRWLNLRDPLPADIDLVVLVRPLRTLSVTELAHLWLHLLRGHHLLLAIDPPGLPSVRPDRTSTPNPDGSRSGLSALLWLNYGIGLQDTFLSEPWFTNTSIATDLTTFTFAYPEDIVVNPVIAPLTELGLPVLVWGARTLAVDALGIGSTAAPLLYSTSAYGETDRKVFAATDPSPLEINLGTDVIGKVMIGALAENSITGSRIALLGDSEIVQNDYGLALDLNTGDPKFWGNRLLVERLAAWLLDLPVEDWPVLPADYTQVPIDGSGDQWPEDEPLISDASGDAPLDRYDIESVHAFRDDGFLYMLIHTAVAPNPNVRVTLEIENTFDGVPDVTLLVDAEHTLVQTGPAAGATVPDSRLQAESVIELRLPLRLIGTGALISQVCLSDGRTDLSSAPIDCTDQPPTVIPVVATHTPASLWTSPVPLVRVYSSQAVAVNLRAEPDTASDIIDNPLNGSVFQAIGRTATGDWIEVQDAQLTGWLADYLVQSNIDLAQLPIVGAAAEETQPPTEASGS